MIGIIDYGMGNLASVKNALDHLNLSNQIVSDPLDLGRFDKLILPGVGAFKMAMKKLSVTGFQNEIMEAVSVQQIPILGICLGLQLLYERSFEHGHQEGLGLIKGEVKSLYDKVLGLVVPHMGWNDVFINGTSLLLNSADKDDCCFYFVHSFYCEATDRSVVTGTTDYGIFFDAVIEKENIFGCQFHPEKSQKAGLTLLKKFADLQC